MLKTRQKLALARSVQIVVLAIRSLMRKGPEAKSIRGGVRWHLDLNEGIDFSIWLLGSFEPETVRCYSRLVRTGDIVLDVGANIGAHSLHLAKLVGDAGRVIAFEPTNYAYAKLLKNLKANPDLDKRVTPLQMMLTDKRGAGNVPDAFYSSWPLVKDQSRHDEHGGRLMPASGAKAGTLDDELASMALDRLDLVKLDIDGFEPRMLRGAGECLRRWSPIIVMELAPYVLEEQQSSIEELVEILAGNGYSLFSLDGKREVRLEAKAIRQLIPEGASLNVVARKAPRSAISSLSGNATIRPASKPDHGLAFGAWPAE